MSNDVMNDDVEGATGRSPLILVAGFALIGIALVLIIFGGQLFDDSEPEAEPILDQVGQISVDDPVVAQIPDGDIGAIGIGDIAPDFALLDVAGNEIQLSQFAGQPVIVNFWATWCAPCRIEMPELQAAQSDYAEDGLVILALNREESVEQVETYFTTEFDSPLTFTALLDSEATVAEAYGVFNMPTTYFINGAGEVAVVHRGPMTESQIADYMATTLEG